MNVLRSIIALGLIACLISIPALVLGEEEKTLFVNLTSDQTDRAVMAIALSHMAQTEQNIPATVFLNVEGVRLADKRLPQKSNAEGKNPQQMLASFIEAGGSVVICPMCMANVGGMSSEDMIDGVALGKADTTFPALFRKNATVLSY